MADEELAASTVRIGRTGHREDTLRVGPIIELGLNLVARATGARLTLGALLGVGATALNHEAFDNTVEGGAFIEAFTRQLEEVVDGARGDVGPELDGHVAVVGMDNGAGSSLRVSGFFHGCGRGVGGLGDGEAEEAGREEAEEFHGNEGKRVGRTRNPKPPLASPPQGGHVRAHRYACNHQ